MLNSDLQNRLLINLAEILSQGNDLLRKIEDRHYSAIERSAVVENTGVGAHFRHCLEFVNSFLAGVENGRIDYEKRERNQRIEMEREYAAAEFLRAIKRLTFFSAPESDNSLLVKPEIVGIGEEIWCSSSIERELDFLQSHTVHHYALIAFKLRAMGFEVPAEFGIAPSTLRFWKHGRSAAS